MDIVYGGKWVAVEKLYAKPRFYEMKNLLLECDEIDGRVCLVDGVRSKVIEVLPLTSSYKFGDTLNWKINHIKEIPLLTSTDTLNFKITTNTSTQPTIKSITIKLIINTSNKK